MTVTAPPWNGNLVRSRLFDGISLLLPAAESFLIATLEEWRAQFEHQLDAHSRDEVRRFLREELAHQKVHLRYNEALVARVPAVRAVAERASRAADDLATLDLATRLAMAAAFEHLTALLSAEILHRPFLLSAPASTEGRMWRWHAREELGHSEVAIDAVVHMGVGRGRRSLAYALASAYLLFDVLRLWIALCRCDVAAGASRWRLAGQAAGFAVGAVPTVLRLALGWVGYLLPGRRSFARQASAVED